VIEFEEKSAAFVLEQHRKLKAKSPNVDEIKW